MQLEVTKKLKQEHQLILKYIALLGEYLDKIKEQPESNFLIDKIPPFVDFIKTYADQYHHAKEENILFKHLECPGVLTHCNPVPQMLHEHDYGRVYVKNIMSSMAKKDHYGVIENAQAWRDLLSEHIYKEDNILYPMGEEGLSEEEKQQITIEYQRTEEEIKGDMLQAKYEELYLKLNEYLKSIEAYDPATTFPATT